MIFNCIKISGYYARGYDISYTTTNEGRGCGGELYNTRGTVTSPGFPSRLGF